MEGVMSNGYNLEKLDLKDVMRDFNKQVGYDAVRLGADIPERERIPFKQKYLNDLSGGGIPCGLFSVLWGGSSVGKSTSCYELIAQAQKMGKVCIYCDLEHSYSEQYARRCGVDTTKNFIYADFYQAEQPLDMIIKFCKANAAGLIIIDSLHGLSPKGEQVEGKAEKDKSVANDSMALLARKLSQFFRMAAGFVSNSQTAVVLIGQTRLDLGAFIKLETLSGGHALLHWASLILFFRRGQKADAPTKTVLVDGKKEQVIDGFSCVIKVTKSKVPGSVAGNEVALPFYTGYGLTDGERPEVKVEAPIVEEVKADKVVAPPVEAPKKRGRKAKKE